MNEMGKRDGFLILAFYYPILTGALKTVDFQRETQYLRIKTNLSTKTFPNRQKIVYRNQEIGK